MNVSSLSFYAVVDDREEGDGVLVLEISVLEGMPTITVIECFGDTKYDKGHVIAPDAGRYRLAIGKRLCFFRETGGGVSGADRPSSVEAEGLDCVTEEGFFFPGKVRELSLNLFDADAYAWTLFGGIPQDAEHLADSARAFTLEVLGRIRGNLHVVADMRPDFCLACLAA